MSGNTVTLHRVMKVTPERLYRDFLDADTLAKWCPPHGITFVLTHLISLNAFIHTAKLST